MTLSFTKFLREWTPVLAFLVVTQCIAQPVIIPSGSMEPTMHAGDVLFVNKLAYNFHLPLVSTAEVVRWAYPARGDVVVFNAPVRASKSEALYIKRVVGLPGDVIEVHNHRLRINGQPLTYKDQPSGVIEELGSSSHVILANTSTLAEFGPFTVPRGHVFVMGDHRDNSSDSRVWGALPLERLRGRALFRVAGLNPEHLKAPGSL